MNTFVLCSAVTILYFWDHLEADGDPVTEASLHGRTFAIDLSIWIVEARTAVALGRQHEAARVVDQWRAVDQLEQLQRDIDRRRHLANKWRQHRERHHDLIYSINHYNILAVMIDYCDSLL